MGMGVGVGGCGRAGIWAAQCHTREDCRENTRGWGRLEGQGYQRVCEDREGQASCLNHHRMDKPSKEGRYTEGLVDIHTCTIPAFACFSYTHAQTMSSNTAVSVWIFNETPPLSSSIKSAH